MFLRGHKSDFGIFDIIPKEQLQELFKIWAGEVTGSLRGLIVFLSQKPLG